MRAPEFWRRDGGALGEVLAPLGWCYGLATRIRLAWVRPWRPPVPVLCVGNLVAGGAGKTPVVLSLGAYLGQRGYKVHFLGRGYGGTAAGPHRVDPESDAAAVGDEALLLARAQPTWISRDRIAGVRAAAEGADLIVMDDGFQNPSVVKDFSVLVVDGRYGFGNGHLIPAGPLRETVQGGLERAHALVVIGDDEAGVENNSAVAGGGLPVLKASVRPGPEAEALGGKPVFAFAGIGDPGKFFATLKKIGCEIKGTAVFSDHHRFTVDEISRLKSQAIETEAQLVTTEKDAVRLPPAARDGIEVLTISLQWVDEASLDAVFGPLFDRL